MFIKLLCKKVGETSPTCIPRLKCYAVMLRGGIWVKPNHLAVDMLSPRPPPLPPRNQRKHQTNARGEIQQSVQGGAVNRGLKRFFFTL